MKASKPTASENFRALTKRVVSAPRNEIVRREVKYRNARKNKSHRRHR